MTGGIVVDPMAAAPDLGPASDSVLLHDAFARKWLYFSRPKRVLVAQTVDEVRSVLERVEAAVADHGLHAAGCVAYEAAPAFDAALVTRPRGRLPLAWFGLYAAPEAIELPEEAPAAEDPPPTWLPTIDDEAYRRSVRAVRRHIELGHTYQVNFSFRLRADGLGDPWGLFQRMIRAQGAGYGAMITTDTWCICSSSPELFFRLDGQLLTSRPMKGTAARGLWAADDRAQADWLRASEKNQAENVMIVDMVRNDLGRIARLGTVRVEELFAIEQYPTVWQMTSTVSCKTDASLPAIFDALFPPASITGAPKASTMAIIADLEDTPREIYTGTIGYLAPGRRAQFNVAIRTAWLDPASRAAEYGVGGGIVWDSTEGAELAEAYAKAAVLTAAVPPFALLETLIWEPATGYRLLEAHLERLVASAAYFGFPVDVDAIRGRLAALAATMPPAPRRVRLTLSAAGEIALANDLLRPPPADYRLALADSPVDSRDRFLYHKTTRRQVYERALRAWPGYDDALLWNERGEVTESCIANVIVERDGRLFTPPIASGLLPGTCRAQLLADGRVAERIVRVAELGDCSAIYLANAVRGVWRAQLDPATLTPG